MQIFPRSLNLLPAILAVGVALGGGLVTGIVWYYFTPKHTHVGYAPRQPVPYSHWLHAGQMGMDCRYCHSNVERAAHAQIPPTQTCMNCHGLVRTDSARLRPVRESWCSTLPVDQRTAQNCPGVADARRPELEPNQAVEWVRVHRLPDHVYFDHSAHVTAGVGCVECHGRVDQMEVVRHDQPLSMQWCLDCHRNPAPHIRPLDQITNMDPNLSGTAQPPRTLNPPQSCSGCHR
jgi:hypothetical protein